jgi:SAM-dependent methyltransferase
MDIHLISEALRDCTSIVDLGCGPNTALRHLSGKHTIGVDAHAPSIEVSRANKLHDDYFIGTAQDFLESRGPKSVDGVVLLDLIEHFEKAEGLRLLGLVEQIARKKVVVFTPVGFVSQPPAPDNPWQEHRSGWAPKEFRERGYTVTGASGWKPMRGMYARWRRPKIVCAPISILSEPIVYYLPELAFAQHAVKAL